MKAFRTVFGYVALSFTIVLAAALFVESAVTQVAGLAVAQSGTRWNNLKDFAFGDGATNGVLLSAPCLYNGSTCDRQRGTIANGALVDVTRIAGTITPADNYANPTTANQVWSLNGLANASLLWDRARTTQSDTQSATGIQAVNAMKFNPANSLFYRDRAAVNSVEVGTLLNSSTTSAANTINTVTLSATGSQQNYIYRVAAFCSAGTSTLTILEGATTRYTTPTGAIGTAEYVIAFPVGMAAATSTAMSVTVQACGVGNTSTINLEAARN